MERAKQSEELREMKVDRRQWDREIERELEGGEEMRERERQREENDEGGQKRDKQADIEEGRKECTWQIGRSEEPGSHAH